MRQPTISITSVHIVGNNDRSQTAQEERTEACTKISMALMHFADICCQANAEGHSLSQVHALSNLVQTESTMTFFGEATHSAIAGVRLCYNGLKYSRLKPGVTIRTSDVIDMANWMSYYLQKKPVIFEDSDLKQTAIVWDEDMSPQDAELAKFGPSGGDVVSQAGSDELDPDIPF